MIENFLLIGIVGLNFEKEIRTEMGMKLLNDVIDILVFPKRDTGCCDHDIARRKREKKFQVKTRFVIVTGFVGGGKNLVDGLASVFVFGKQDDV